MSAGPTRQRSLKEILREGVSLPLQRRRSSQISSGIKNNKPDVITSKIDKASFNVGCNDNSHSKWSCQMNKKKADTMIGLHQPQSGFKQPSSTTSASQHKLLFKSTSVPIPHQDIPSVKEKHQVTRTMTQPIGTITYMVQDSDSLTSIAARFDTTPSELVKLNRLVSRYVFPAQVLFIPDKSSISFEDTVSSEGDPGSMPVNQTEHQPAEHQASPKPGHVERIQSPVMSPTITPLTEEEEKNLDKECIEKFLKINVRHITDGQGVVCGVLLVTPNNIMFDPNVSDPLVIEHGPEKYGVIAPMDYVINAAMYNDIATMFVSHAPDRSIDSHPEVYHAKECLLSWQSTLSPPLGQHSRSDSEQAVNGSISDMAEAGTPEGDRASLSSCQMSGGSAFQNSDSTINLDSEVFLDDNSQCSVASPSLVRKDSGDKAAQSVDKLSQDTAELLTSKDKEECERRLSEGSARDKLQDSLPKSTLSLISKSNANVKVSESTTKMLGSFQKQDVVSETEKDLSDRECYATDRPSSSTDSSTSQQQIHAAVAAPVEQVLKESFMRKNSSSPLESKMKVLKRLSYPLTWMESFSATEKDKENAPPLASLSEAPSGNISGPFLPAGSQSQSQQSTLSKILSSSPRTLVDFSSGLFTRTSEDSETIAKDFLLSQKPPNLHETFSGTTNDFNDSFATHLETGDVGAKTLLFESESSTTCSSVNKADSADVPESKSRTYSEVKKHSPSGNVVVRETKVGFKSIVSVDDMPDLFASIDQLIPRPAKPCDDPPLYLCLKMGIPVDKKKYKNIAALAYGKKCMKREYWFSIPRDRVDELYSFFNHWAPNVYGELDEKALIEKGFELIGSEEEISDDEGSRRDSFDGSSSFHSHGDGTQGKSYSDWEMMKAPHIKLFARLRRDADYTERPFEVITSLDLKKQMSIEVELPLPDLIGKTDILTEDHRKALTKHLPARAVGYAWTLIFSTSQHGFSLKTLYRKMSPFQTPILLTILDTDNNVFGALTSCSLRLSDHFYGSGESFLYTFFPEFKLFHWTGENVYYIKGNNESLAIGAGDGVFGLWLDGDLYHGRSHPCKTYNNTMLSSSEDFCVKTLEAWGFVEVDTTCA